MIGDQQFRGGEAGELVEELGGVRKLGDDELAGGVIDGGKAVAVFDFREGGEVVRALIVEESEVVDGASGEDAGDLALDEFPGNGLGGLLGDGDSFTSLEEAGDVVLCGVIGDTAHGCATAFREGYVEDGRGGFRVLEEHLVEIP